MVHVLPDDKVTTILHRTDKEKAKQASIMLAGKPYPLLVVLTCWAHISACELDEVTDIVVDGLLGLELVTFFRGLEGTSLVVVMMLMILKLLLLKYFAGDIFLCCFCQCLFMAVEKN